MDWLYWERGSVDLAHWGIFEFDQSVCGSVSVGSFFLSATDHKLG